MLVKSIGSKSSVSLSFRGALLASGVMAFAGIGDALLYPVLPVFGQELGFSPFMVGLLLSVNRFVRIIANTQVANLIRQFGMRKILIISSIMAVLTTIFYGFQIGIVVFLLARIAWGLSYSGLKIATLNYASATEEKSGLAFGLTTSIKTLGVLFALSAGPFFINRYGMTHGFLLIAIISAIGVVLAFLLPENNKQESDGPVKTKRTFYPSSINLLVFILALSVDGILVVCLASLLSGFYPDAATLLAGVSLYILIKRLAMFMLSLISGVLTIRISVQSMFKIGVLFCIVGVFLIGFGFTVFGIILAFFFNTLVVTFSPLVAIQTSLHDHSTANRLQAISGISTWWDLGAAFGAFLGVFLVKLLGVQFLFMVLACLMTTLFINFIKQHAKPSRTVV